MKNKKYRSLYLPKIIVDNILLVHNLNPLKDTNKPPLEVAFAIIHDIISKTDMYNRDDKYSFHHIPMYSRYLEIKYGEDYKRYIHWLFVNNIIWCDESSIGNATHYYLQSNKTYSDLLNHSLSRLDGDTTSYTYSTINDIEITSVNTDSNRIQKNQKSGTFEEYCKIKILITTKNRSFLTKDYTKDTKFISNAPKHIRAMGRHYMSNLSIDVNGATEHTINQYHKELLDATTDEQKQRAYRRYSTRMDSIYAIQGRRKNKSLRFSRNTTNRRIDTNLTNMSSDLRPFIVGYENMCYLDLKNSQPVLFNILLKDKRKGATKEQLKELDEYFDLTISGKWYERIAEIFNCDRETAKEAWMVIAYSKNTTPRYKPLKRDFYKHFPFIGKIIENIKKTNHSQFAIELQNVESKLFIDKICRELFKLDIIPYTFHDAILIPKHHKNKALEVMETILEKELGAVPKISIEDGGECKLENNEPKPIETSAEPVEIVNYLFSAYQMLNLEVDFKAISDIQGLINESYADEAEVCHNILKIFKENRYKESPYEHINIPRELAEHCLALIKEKSNVAV